MASHCNRCTDTQADQSRSHGMKTSEQDKSWQTPLACLQRYTGLLKNSLSES